MTLIIVTTSVRQRDYYFTNDDTCTAREGSKYVMSLSDIEFYHKCASVTLKHCQICLNLNAWSRGEALEKKGVRDFFLFFIFS